MLFTLFFPQKWHKYKKGWLQKFEQLFIIQYKQFQPHILISVRNLCYSNLCMYLCHLANASETYRQPVSLTFPYCNLTYVSNFPDLSFVARSFASTTVISSFLPVFDCRVDDPLSDGQELVPRLFKLCEPSANCHSFTTILTFN